MDCKVVSGRRNVGSDSAVSVRSSSKSESDSKSEDVSEKGVFSVKMMNPSPELVPIGLPNTEESL